LNNLLKKRIKLFENFLVIKIKSNEIKGYVMNIEDYKFDEKWARQPFEVPENYFEDFAARMDARLAEEMKMVQPKEEVKGRRIDFRRLAALVASSAAVFAGLLIAGVALINMQQQVDSQASEIIAQETYVDEMLEMMDIHHIELALADAEFVDED
jgi:hypothetical protein